MLAHVARAIARDGIYGANETYVAVLATIRDAFDRALGGGSDDEQIGHMLVEGDDEHALRAEVRRFLRLNAGTLRFLAAKLKRHGALSGSEVERVVRGKR